MVGTPGAPQLDLLTYGKENKAYKKDVHLFPIQLDEKLTVLHLPALGAVLTFFAKEHADYIAVQIPVESVVARASHAGRE